jgi:VWFA-related protein
MKLKIFVFLVIAFCLNLSSAFAQSRRPVQSDDTKKANVRPAATPTPKTETTENGQTEETTSDDSVAESGDIEVSTEIVNFPLKVLDRKGRFVPGLQKENFKVFEGDKEQPIEFFNNEQQPFTVALVLDMSYSATFKINEIQAAATAFINQLRKDDKIMVVSFTEEVVVWTEPTTDRQKIYNAIKQTKIGSGTSLYEAVDQVIKKFRTNNGRKAIVLFTDGVDTTSRKAYDLSNVRDVLETDILVYPIRYDTFADVQRMKDQTVVVPPTQPNPIPSSTPSPFPFPIPTGGIGTPSGQGTSVEDYEKAKRYLDDMANRTGGEIYEANTTGNLDRAFSSIAAQLREFYSLGYYLPENAKMGEKRRVKIKVDRENVAVKAKENYTVGKKAEKGKK